MLRGFAQQPTIRRPAGSDTLIAGPAGQYQWYLDSHPLHGADSNTLAIQGPGTYTVAALGTAGECPSRPSAPFVIVAIRPSQRVALRLAPNPARSSVTLSGVAKIGNVSVVDALGRTMLTLNAHGADHLTLPISELPTGAYSVLAEVPGGRAVGRFVRE